jgi:hypothetical protein
MITQLDGPCWVARWRNLGPNPLGEPHFPDKQSAGLEVIRMAKVDVTADIACLPLPVACWEIRCDTCPAILTANEFPEAREFDIHAETLAEAEAWADERGWLVLPGPSCYCKGCRDSFENPRPGLRSVNSGARR